MLLTTLGNHHKMDKELDIMIHFITDCPSGTQLCKTLLLSRFTHPCSRHPTRASNYKSGISYYMENLDAAPFAMETYGTKEKLSAPLPPSHSSPTCRAGIGSRKKLSHSNRRTGDPQNPLVFSNSQVLLEKHCQELLPWGRNAL